MQDRFDTEKILWEKLQQMSFEELEKAYTRIKKVKEAQQDDAVDEDNANES